MRKESLRQLNGIKALAFMFVFLWHVSSIFPFIIPSLGSRGVEIFFVISGFLVAYNYYDGDGFANLSDGIKYSIKKAKKIYPLYFVTFIPMALVFWREIFKNPSLSNVVCGGGTTLVNLLILQSWIPSSDVYWAFNGVAWYLSSILFCYAVTPLLFKIIRKFRNHSFIIIVLCFALKIIIELATNCLPEDIGTYLFYICPVTRTIDYLAGVSMFIWWEDYRNRIQGRIKLQTVQILYVIGYALLLLLARNPVLLTLLDIPSALLVFVFIPETRVNKVIFENHVAQYLGGLSMELFLIHLPVINIGHMILEKISEVMSFVIPYYIEILVWFILSIAFSEIYRKFFKFRKIKKISRAT